MTLNFRMTRLLEQNSLPRWITDTVSETEVKFTMYNEVESMGLELTEEYVTVVFHRLSLQNMKNHEDINPVIRSSNR